MNESLSWLLEVWDIDKAMPGRQNLLQALINHALNLHSLCSHTCEWSQVKLPLISLRQVNATLPVLPETLHLEVTGADISKCNKNSLAVASSRSLLALQ